MLLGNYKLKGKNVNNLGDQIQIITIDYLYKKIGIKKDDIIYIDLDDLSTYDGPLVRLPVSMPLIRYCENGIAGMFSPNIIPVFLGMTTPRDVLSVREVEYLKKYEPIGCRDEKAYHTMRKYDIKAYLGGCITVTLPKRKVKSTMPSKVFLVDIPIDVKKFIPSSIMQHAVCGTHMVYHKLNNPKELAEEQYQKYRDEAKLVVTSLLHAAIPCAAFGIPVIIVKKDVSYRFSWVESLLPIYIPQDYNNINWDPKELELDKHKEKVISLFQKRMHSETANNEIEYIHGFYMNRQRCTYINDTFIQFQNYIETNWLDKEKSFCYSVWGMTQMVEILVDYISENYPYAKLAHVYDIRPNMKFRGITVDNPDEICKNMAEFVFVTALGAVNQAQELFCKINKPLDSYIMLETIR